MLRINPGWHRLGLALLCWAWPGGLALTAAHETPSPWLCCLPCCESCCFTLTAAEPPPTCLKKESDAPQSKEVSYRVGIGFRMVRTDTLSEMSVAFLSPGGPGEKGGLLAGDEIVAINGRPASEFATDALTKVFRSPQAIQLKIRRDGTTTLEVVITPQIDPGGEGVRSTTMEYRVDAAAAGQSGGPKIGELAPEIVGEDTDGVPFKLSDYRGKVVVVDFYGFW